MTKNTNDGSDSETDPRPTDAEPTAHTSSTWKVLGEHPETGATGVLGHSTAGSGSGIGVEGVADSTEFDAIAVRANAPNGGTGLRSIASGNFAIDARTSNYTTVSAVTNGRDYNALEGSNEATAGRSWGVRGETASTDSDANGVKGFANASDGAGNGVSGTAKGSGNGAAGVYGEATAGSGTTYGVDGVTQSSESDAAGVRGRAPNGGVGVYADAGSGGNAITATARVDIETSIGGSGASTPDNYPLFVSNTDTSSGNQVLGLRTGTTGDPSGTHNFVQFLSPNGSGGTDFNGAIEGDGSGGVTYSTTGADYAEYLPRLDPDEALEAGDVVGVFGNAITTRTDGATRVMVVSGAPNVAGNAPSDGDTDGYETVAFTGTVPVKVRNAVSDGDLVVPSGEEDGTAVAIPPTEWTPGTPLIGQAWEATEEPGISEVAVVVGIDDPAVVGETLRAHRNRIDELEARLDEHGDRLETLEAELAKRGAAPAPADD